MPTIRARARPAAGPAASIACRWTWFQPRAHAECAVGAAKPTTARERSGNVAAHSSATMPPSDPPVASATRRTPSASTTHPGEETSLVACRKARGARRLERPPLECRAVARAEQVRAQDGPAARVDGLAGPDDGAFPPAQRFGRAGERVKDEDEVVAARVQRAFEDIRLPHVAQDLAGLEREARREVNAGGRHVRTALRKARSRSWEIGRASCR